SPRIDVWRGGLPRRSADLGVLLLAARTDGRRIHARLCETPHPWKYIGFQSSADRCRRCRPLRPRGGRAQPLRRSPGGIAGRVALGPPRGPQSTRARNDRSIVRTAVPSAELLCPHLVLHHTIPYERIEPWRHVRMSELSSRTPRIRDGKQSRRSAKSATTWRLRSTSP